MASHDPIQALIFDFDGLILDTETPDLQSWEDVFHAYGVEFPVSEWIKALGGSPGLFDPIQVLQERVGDRLDVEAVRSMKVRRDDALLAGLEPMPGVIELIEDGKSRGLKLGLASSSAADWVVPKLSDLGMLPQFDCIRCSDHVRQAKPDPDLYHAVLEELKLDGPNAVAFEDSPNGVLAAKRAGTYCVAVPNQVTAGLNLDQADLQLDSLAGVSVAELIQLLAEVMGS